MALVGDRETTLVPEILGFAPQLLIDDLLDVGIDAGDKAVEAFEKFLDEAWLPGKSEEDYNQVDAGLTAFYTLLQLHLDKAFDAFEHWSLNNVFKIPPDLQIVMPHHQGLDLTVPQQVETETLVEIEDLRRKVEAYRRMQAKLKMAVRSSNARLARSAARLEQLRFLSELAGNESLPDHVKALLERVQSLPPIPPSTVAPLDPTKRPWETTHAGYMEWISKRTIERAAQPGESDVVMEDVRLETGAIGTKEDLENATASTS